MSSIEQFLVIGGFFLLGLLILNINKSESISSSAIYNNEAVITGTGMGESMLNQIMSKAFDQKTVNAVVSKVTNLTRPSRLGKDDDEETPDQFNDVDDYNNYFNIESIKPLGDFAVRVKVYYVSYNFPDIKSIVSTFIKRIDITVTNPMLTDKLKFSQLVSY